MNDSTHTRHDGAMHRSRLPIPAPALLCAVLLLGWMVAGCSRLQSIGANPPTTTSIAPWTTAPDAELWSPIMSLCTMANDEALADAQQLLPLDSTADPSNLAEYYRHRAAHIDALVDEFTHLDAPAAVADKWTAALQELTVSATWARTVADRVEANGLKVDQTPPPGLEHFRALMPYGACHDLLDVN